MELEDLLYLLVLFARLIAGTAGHNITCSVPSVAAGQTTSLTCNFGRDISQERRDFVIHKYDLDYNYQGFALYCYWLDSFGKPSCETMPGYDFNEQVNDSMTLHIPNATENNVGIYACQVTPTEPEDLPQTCLFRLKETTAEVPVTSTVFPRNQGEVDARLVPALLVSLVCLVGVIAASVVVFIIKRRLWNHCCKSHTQPADQPQQILLQTYASDATSTEVCLKKHLLRACSRNSIKEVKALLNSGAPVNCHDESKNSETPLHVACRCGSEDLLKLLLNKGADIEAKNKEGFTPLHTACKYGRKVAVERLIARGANINAAGEGALTPLHLACQYDHTDVLEQLLSAGAKIEAKDIKQMRPLHLACKTGSPDLVDTLIK
ncbi:hypothetical protein BaRGS_00013325 [Batillaria attramentaria]|uniref:Uncharacterized protein n=1 Tax=Batillaria attramentaria TaxID=370345 RepID=A0ABD0L750_9CAEN